MLTSEMTNLFSNLEPSVEAEWITTEAARLFERLRLLDEFDKIRAINAIKIALHNKKARCATKYG